MSWRPRIAAGALIAGLLSAPAAAQNWYEVDAPHFRVYSDLGARATVHSAEQLERLLDYYRAFFHPRRELLVPRLNARVYVFRHRRSIERLRPPELERDMQGSYARKLGVLFLAYSHEGSRREREHLLLHELTHAYLDQTLLVKPLWLHEGLAMYFQNARLQADSLLLGGLDDELLRLLRRHGMPPLAEFLELDSSTGEYRRRHSARLYYARSWLLTHWLIHGRSGRNRQPFDELLARLAAGQDEILALRHAYRADIEELDRELQRQLRRGLQPAHERLRSPRPGPAVELSARQLDNANSRGLIALLALALSNHPAADALIAAAAKPEQPALLLARAFAELLADRAASARELAARQLESALPDPLAAVIMADASHSLSEPARLSTDALLMGALGQAIRDEPAFAPAYHRLALSLRDTPECVEAGLLAARWARRLDHGEPAYIWTLADYLDRYQVQAPQLAGLPPADTSVNLPLLAPPATLGSRGDREQPPLMATAPISGPRGRTARTGPGCGLAPHNLPSIPDPARRRR